MVPLPQPYRISLELPALERERSAHGLSAEVCTLTVGMRGKADARQLARLTDRLLQSGGDLFAVVIGDFGTNVAESVTGLRQINTRIGDSEVYAVANSESLNSLFDAHSEMIAVFRASADVLSNALKADAASKTRWWKRSEKSDVGRLASLTASVGLVAVYSAPDVAIEFFGDDESVITAFARLVDLRKE
jgi:hypothetical protein